jgi:peptidoglycan/xylan/chitin deacetylase (PgdA/CDA1 family)
MTAIALSALAVSGCSATPEAPAPTASAIAPSAAASPTPSPTATPRPPSRPVGASDPAASAPVVVHGRRDLPQVALTFDADMTPSALAKLQSGAVDSYANTDLIEALRARKVPATMFLGGLWMQAYPELTRELAADPMFELGTHSWSHPAFVPDCYTLPTLSGSAMDEMTPTQNLLDELAGDRATHLFRFPGLCHDEATLAAIAPAAVTVLDGDVFGADGFQPNPQAIVDTVLAGAGSNWSPSARCSISCDTGHAVMRYPFAGLDRPPGR